jgi:K+-sensing histidine kinase KdpD
LVTELEILHKTQDEPHHRLLNLMTKFTELPPTTVLETDGGDFLEVLRMLAHRMSQPLTSLCGSIEVALMGELDETECRRVLELSLQESHRMAEILDTLRDILEMEGDGEQAQPVSWTRSVEKLLEQAASVDKDRCPRLVSEVEEVWVNASPQHLDIATARLIGGAIRAARSGREVRVNLSVHGETACLSVCEEGVTSEADAAAGPFPSAFIQESSVLGGPEKWVVCRAIQRQNGWLKVSQVSETCRCYQLYLPLAASEIVRP